MNRSIKFELVHRSKADPFYYEEGSSPWVLVPVNDPKFIHRVDPNIDPYAVKESDFFGESSDEDDYDDDEDEEDINIEQPPPPPPTCPASKSKTEIKIPFNPEDYGLPNDGYDYSKHLKKRGEGVFINANGEMEEEIVTENDKSKEPIDLLSYLPEDLLPQEMRSEKIIESEKIYEDEVDPEVLAALEDPDAFIEEDGELDDDFVLKASEVDNNNNNNNNNSTFDLEAHLQHLLEEAEKEDNQRNNKNNNNRHVKFNDEEEEEDDDYRTMQKEPIRHVETDREKRLVDEHFDVVLDSYKDEDIGDLGDEEIVGGNVDLDNEYLMSLCDEFIQHPDRVHISKKNQVIKKSEVVNLTKELLSKRPDLVDISVNPEDEDNEYNNNNNNNEYDEYDDDRNMKWDIETVHSTYTNTENLPTVIREPKKIKLSKKSGIPLNSFTTKANSNNNNDNNEDNDKEEENEENESIKTSPIQYSRKKGESKEEKKLRKLQIKQQKQKRREEKKMNKIMFKEEEKLATKENVVMKKGRSTYIL